MMLVRWGLRPSGVYWGVAEDRRGYWLVTGSDIHEVFEAVVEELATEYYPTYERALEAAREL